MFAVISPKLKNKYTEGYDERMGAPSSEKLSALRGRRPLWIHGVSVGEVQASIPIMREARRAGYDGPIILSTTTETGKAMAMRLSDGLFDTHIYYPWDRDKYVTSALDAVDPWAFVTMETELWPNMLWRLKDRKIPAFMANGRISDRTWKRLGSFAGRRVGKEIYGLFSDICLREARDSERLIEIGVPERKLHVVGDTKIDALLSRRDDEAREKLRSNFGYPERPVFMAGSTHHGEDEEVLAAYKILTKSTKDARLIVAPRHPERADDVLELFKGGYSATKLSENMDGWDVLVVDKIGALFDLYGISVSAFVGGSFTDNGGQNILEPASWGVPVQYGPHMEDFAEASEDLIELGIAEQVPDGKSLGEVWTRIAQCHDTEKYINISDEYFANKSGAAERTWKILSSYAPMA
ncbi:MAG: glycosyltransferase N-terminal domain-containing protein [Synergistaceae bacterium]|nr:glycosyltransferase N-terminal domain-containing protein [Synergistaceae bacterium]